MEEKLYEYGSDWEVIRVVIERKGLDKVLSFALKFEKGNVTEELEFLGPKNIESIPELIDMEHIVVSREKDSQKEYGTIKVEFFGECWQEVWCDSVNKVG
ncbi:hypothetical protein KCM76_24980 [Zooshikella marina]|uniref:hypothetical protein n=1 Tax=Zooshikella ganghwensis TaxID=202772 RepID=UPI001BB016B1|nr:hypothetical protein [Zooshikella ganghwensis]MBU2709274.1 hypothetical protein [Zooshikella ganghwensis]